MRIRMISLGVALTLLTGGCSPTVSESAKTSTSAEPTTTSDIASLHGEPAQDALLRAASEVSTATPVRIIGYELVMWEQGALDFEVFVTKSGEFMQPEGMWGAGPDFAPLEERPPARIKPSSPEEAQAEQATLRFALERAKSQGWGSDEALVRIYLLEDANGKRFLLSPSGEVTAPAPVLGPWL